MMQNRHLAALVAIMVSLGLITACRPKKPSFLDWDDGQFSESRWSAAFVSGEESISLILILMTSQNTGRARLVAISPLGMTLGDCLVEEGKGRCLGPQTAEGLVTKISGAVGAMLEHDAAFLLQPAQGPAAIGAYGWRAKREAAGKIEYRLDSPSSWILVMTKMAEK
ncbi:MAG: hypothetical protein LBT47_05505 [Deltaproteobacteria bacterium]|jgi:hypothetical protein|nr:hypothetical protein [Deltaproteobacteria bacterium]